LNDNAASDMESGLGGRAAALRAAFDRSFAEPAGAEATAQENLLSIRVGPQACAVRLSDVAGLFAGKPVTRLPSEAPALLGIAGFRGTIMPVYDLGMLLGQPRAESARWLVVAAAAPVALAFDSFDGHLRVAADVIVPRQAGDSADRHVREFLRVPDLVLPIVHLPSVLDAVREQAPEAAQSESTQR
jgi:chemotaxis signal transduction protein